MKNLFFKKREVPHRVRAEEALISRLPINHSKLPLIEEDYRRRIAGIRGEKELDYQLSFLPREKYIIINDLRLKQDQHYFQIDSLLISPRLSFIIDSKNISGTVIFDHSFNQLIRVFQNKEERMRDPITQVRRHVQQLTQWLNDQKLPPLQLEHLVVFSNSSTIIKAQSANSPNNKRIIHAEQVAERINFFEKQYQKEMINGKDVKKIAKQLVKSHSPLFTDILETYSIRSSEIITGVKCPSCSYIPMKRMHGNWQCPSCSFQSKDAHYRSLQDYCLLIGQTITLNQFCDFLLFPYSKRKTASSILISLNLPHKGTKKGRVYDLSPLMKI